MDGLVTKTFMQSNVWDKRFNLPLLPDHSNPWIYSAYALKLIKDSKEDTKDLYRDFRYYAERCKVETGLYNRKPDNIGGAMSHDELIGICYSNQEISKDILMYYDFHDGQYDNTKDNTVHPDRYNISKFFWVRPFIAKRAGATVSIKSEIMWSFHVLLSAFKAELDNCDSKLMIWLMAEYMKDHVLCWISYKFWKYRMNKKGITLPVMFEKALKNYPVYKDSAIACYGISAFDK